MVYVPPEPFRARCLVRAHSQGPWDGVGCCGSRATSLPSAALMWCHWWSPLAGPVCGGSGWPGWFGPWPGTRFPLGRGFLGPGWEEVSSLPWSNPLLAGGSGESHLPPALLGSLRSSFGLGSPAGRMASSWATGHGFPGALILPGLSLLEAVGLSLLGAGPGPRLQASPPRVILGWPPAPPRWAACQATTPQAGLA